MIGNPTAISPDGTAIAGFQGGTQRIIGAPGWIWLATGGPSCVAPAVTLNPTASTAISGCSSSIILSVNASGTGPLTYQWYKDGVAMSDGTNPTGSTVTGSSTFQLRVNSPLTPSDTGTYYATVTGQCGSMVQSTNAAVTLDAAFPAAANDVCSTAQTVAAGTNVLGTGQSPCGAYTADPYWAGSSGCSSTNLKADRWFSFTPTASGNYRFDTCGSGYDTVISIFDNCQGSELVCNNDYNIGPSTGCSSNRSRIGSFTMVRGQNYKIRIACPVATFLSTSSVMNLSITNAPASAANDTCANAATAIAGTNAFDTTEATNDVIPTCGTVAARDVWFKYTAGGRGSIRLATCPGTSYDTVLTAYDQCFGTELACNDNASISGCSSQSIIPALQVLGGQTIYIRVAGKSLANFGAGVLTLDFACLADFNQDGGVDGADVDAFFTAWATGVAAADINLDGGVDGSDIEPFFALWESGGC